MNLPACDFCGGPIWDLCDVAIQWITVRGAIHTPASAPPLWIAHGGCGESSLHERLDGDPVIQALPDDVVNWHEVYADKLTLWGDPSELLEPAGAEHRALAKRLLGDVHRIAAATTPARRQELVAQIEASMRAVRKAAR